MDKYQVAPGYSCNMFLQFVEKSIGWFLIIYLKLLENSWGNFPHFRYRTEIHQIVVLLSYIYIPCVFIYIYIYIYIYICVHNILIYVHICVYIYIYIIIWTCILLYEYVSISLSHYILWNINNNFPCYPVSSSYGDYLSSMMFIDIYVPNHRL